MAEIKISELSIGDWVRYDFPEIGKRNIQVHSIDEEDNHIGAGGVGASVWSDVSVFEPIPLTPEILEKNGFEIIEESADFQLYGSPECSIFFTKGTVRYRLETPQASVVCYFVHQLQHALRLAGVENEIEV